MNPQTMQATLWPGEFHEARSMGGFGERMQREREMRSISLEEIAESTKIGCRMLRALEEEDFDKLPGGIFNKGFVRAYAKFLGIDEEQAVVDFQAAFLEKQQRQATNGSNGLGNSGPGNSGFGNDSSASGDVLSRVEANAYGETGREPDQAAGFMRAAIIIVVLAAVGMLGWKYGPALMRSSGAQSSDVPTANVATPNGGGATTTAPKEIGDATVSLKPTATGAASAVKNPELSAPYRQADNPASTTAADNPPAEPGSFRLRIYAREASWVQIKADGKLLMAAEISASGTRSFQAAKEMIVVLGNAPGVEISYNGRPLPQFAPEQKTRTLTFTPEGLQQ